MGESGGPFVNFSNHPSAQWLPSQRDAAESIAAPVVDIPFPEVSAHADEAALNVIAKKALHAILSHRPRAVAVQGEFWVVERLVDWLSAEGVPCYCAASERDSQTRFEGKEAVKKSRFTFVRWRRFRG